MAKKIAEGKDKVIDETMGKSFPWKKLTAVTAILGAIIASPFVVDRIKDIKEIYDNSLLCRERLDRYNEEINRKEKEWVEQKELDKKNIIALNKKVDDLELERNKYKDIIREQHDLLEYLSKENQSRMQFVLNGLYEKRNNYLSEARSGQVRCVRQDNKQTDDGVVWIGRCEQAASEEAHAEVLKEQIDQYTGVYIKKADEILRILEDQRRNIK